MPHFLRTLCSVAVMVAAIAGCAGSPTMPGSRSVPGVFPVTIMRTGGIAGFQDVLVVSGDGLVSGTRRGKSQWRCQLTPPALERLTRAASRVPWSRLAAADTHPAFPDDLVATVRSPLGGPVRLQDPLTGGSGAFFLDLLAKLNDGSGAAGICAPV